MNRSFLIWNANIIPRVGDWKIIDYHLRLLNLNSGNFHSPNTQKSQETFPIPPPPDLAISLDSNPDSPESYLIVKMKKQVGIQGLKLDRLPCWFGVE